MPLRRLFALCLALLLAGCADPRKRAQEILEKNGERELRREAAFLYKRVFAGHGTGFVVIRLTEWPASFQRYTPLRVGAYRDGFSITLQIHRTGESGLYVVPMGMDFVPQDYNAAKFEKLRDGIYWYSFGE